MSMAAPVHKMCYVIVRTQDTSYTDARPICNRAHQWWTHSGLVVDMHVGEHITCPVCLELMLAREVEQALISGLGG